MSALPLTPHTERGTWNYTIHSAEQDTPAVTGTEDRELIRIRALHTLADPRLTGITREELAVLAADLAPAQAARAEQRFFEQRGGPRRKAKGKHGRSLLTNADNVLIPVVYLRQICSQLVLSEMLEVSTGPIAAAITETGKFLTARRHRIVPTVLRFTSANALRTFLSTDTMPARPNRPATLGDPQLTGMSFQDLTRLIERLSVRQAAEAERRKYRQRGGERRFGARGGIFQEKITDAERVLATILCLRKVCSRDVVVELFDVSRRTIGNANVWVRPLLEEDGYPVTGSVKRYSSAADLLNTNTGETTSRGPESPC